jgi:hypothetical protein
VGFRTTGVVLFRRTLRSNKGASYAETMSIRFLVGAPSSTGDKIGPVIVHCLRVQLDLYRCVPCVLSSV